MTDAPYGLQAIRNKAAGNTLRTKLYRVTASGNTQGIFINDPVRFNSAGLGVIRLSSNAAANTRCLGVVAEVFDENGRPLTFSQPGRGPFLPASTAGWAAVYDSQQVTFMCQADASAAETLVGQYVSLTAATNGNTAAGTSVMQIRAASADTSVKTFQVLGLAPTEARGLGTVANNAAWGNAYIDLEVRIALHSYTST
jgi:hypothetical protein